MQYQTINVANDIFLIDADCPVIASLPASVLAQEGGKGRLTPDEYLNDWNNDSWDLTAASAEMFN